jgi:glycosyltransferase involved in cell wall biosynthesis
MTQKVRVLHVIKTLGLGGAETNLLNLAKAFSKERVETHVAYSFGGDLEGRFIEAGVRLFKYASGDHKVKSLQTVAIVARLARYIRRHRIDIVQTHNFNGHIWGLLAAKLARARVVEHVHDFRYTDPAELARRHGLFGQYAYIRYFRNLPDRVVVLTRDNVRYLESHALAKRERIRELQNGIPLDGGDVDPGRRAAVRASLGIAPDARVILTAARMDPTKNVELIVRIARAVSDADPRVVFVVAGNGPLLAALRTRCAENGLDQRVKLLGFHADVEGLLAAADVFLLPSFLELHSIAILEATKMAVPIVVSRGVGCNDEFVTQGVDGMLCDPFEDAPWIEALTRLMQDDGLRKRIGEAGRATCRARFDIRSTASRFENLYADLVTDRYAFTQQR